MPQTLTDLKEDLESLVALSEVAAQTIKERRDALEGEEGRYEPEAYEHLVRSLDALVGDYEKSTARMRAELSRAGEWSESDATRLIARKRSESDLLRVLQSATGSALSAGDWQSPSFAHTKRSRAGAEQGRIKESQNDYHRDLHAAEEGYAKAFVDAYVDHGSLLPVHAYPTTSGMSAVATALNALAPSLKADSAVLAGASSYFQNKWALESMFPGRVIYADEFDTDGILALARKHKPGIVCLDTLCGAESLQMPDLRTLVPGLEEALGHGSTLVLDNTGLGPFYQPLRDKGRNPFGMKLIVAESLLKYHQFGSDRTNAGIVWAPAGSQEGLSHARMRLGATIADSSVRMLPRPDRGLLERRLKRIGRNTRMLAERLSAHIGQGRGMLSGVTYPGLPEYPGFAWSKDATFHGGFLTLRFKPLYRNTLSYDRMVGRIMEAARTRGVDLVGSTSFGFDTTRIYVAARYSSKAAKPFVRISPGIETVREMEDLCATFEEAIG